MDEHLVSEILPRLQASAGPVDEMMRERLLRGMASLKARARTLLDLAQSAEFYIRKRPIPLSEKATKLLDAGARARLALLGAAFERCQWHAAELEVAARELAEASGLKLGEVAQPLRAAVTGSTVSPPIFEVLEVLGREEALGRIRDSATQGTSPISAVQ